MKNVVLVIGSVTAKQYNEARLKVLRSGVNPKIVRLDPQSWIDGWYFTESLRNKFAPYREKYGKEVFEAKFKRGYWLKWGFDIDPKSVATVVLANESTFPYVAVAVFELREIIDDLILTTWPKGLAHGIWSVDADGYCNT
jgi:hypothetical protein